jgi:KUP system potassium uptake protein
LPHVELASGSPRRQLGLAALIALIEVTPTAAPGMAAWRKRLFLAMARNAASALEYYRLPRDRTVTLGSSIEL